MPRYIFLALLIAQVTPQSCGSSGSTTSPSTPSSPQNTLAVTVNGGPNGDYFNGLFTSIVVCVSGTTNCQTIGGILVDTGSSGLRVLASALTLTLSQKQTPNGSGPLLECQQYLDGSFTWGPLKTADVKMAGEVASNIAVQVIGEGEFSNVPRQCSNGGTANDTVSTLGANGILGVGNFREDCGPSCATGGGGNPGVYFACPSSGCVVTSVASADQLQNPVWKFSGDNNGIAIQLPSVALGGASSVNGTMTFGIGTQSNNGLGSATVQTTDASGNFTTVFNGRSYSGSFIDSGSNGLFFLDTATTNLTTCSDATDFYCPSRTQALSATNRGANGATTAINFNIGNADQLNSRFNAFQEIGGPQTGLFDWGLPFFFGRTVFVAIDGQAAPGGTAPYWAY